MRAARIALLFVAFSSMGCAAVFRDSHPRVHFESDPAGAETRLKDEPRGATPFDADVDRNGTTSVTMKKPGYNDHIAVVPKKLNPGWLTVDILTCAFPIALCIPLLIDAITGAWTDLPKDYTAKLELATGATPQPPPVASGTPAPTTTAAVATPPPRSDMSESERKATARAAYLEGVTLQEKSDFAGALPRFETAQRLYDAPTHLLHIAQCQAATGRLVEAQETYETLAHANIAASAPDAFKQAQETAKKDLPALKPRVPSLRIQLVPAASTLTGLVVLLNGHPTPNELIGIARPVNPGAYKLSASAKGMKAVTVDVDVKEGEQKAVEVKLLK